MLLAPIRSYRVSISHQSDRRIRVCISHQSEHRFCPLFERCSNFNEEMRDSERAVREMKSSFVMRNVSFFAFYEKCDTTGQMKDIRLPIVNVLLLL